MGALQNAQPWWCISASLWILDPGHAHTSCLVCNPPAWVPQAGKSCKHCQLLLMAPGASCQYLLLVTMPAGYVRKLNGVRPRQGPWSMERLLLEEVQTCYRNVHRLAHGIHCPVCRPSATGALMSMSGSLLEHAANGASSFPGLEAARTSKGMAMPGQKPGQAAPIKLEGELPHKQPVRGTCCTDR